MLIPIVNRFTCNKRQLLYFKKMINSKNMKPILDFTNENYKDHQKNFNEIMQLCKEYNNEKIAVKLTSLNVYDQTCVENYLDHIVLQCIKNNNTLLIDAEYYSVQDNINKITNIFMEQYNINELYIYKTYQLYRKDYLDILKNDLNKYRNYRIGVKLVRGAYYNEDKKHNILFDNIQDSHDNYNKGIEYFINYHKKHDKLLCATHNKTSTEIASSYIDNYNLTNIEFAQLLGMSDSISKKLAEKYNVYKYLPYGDFKDTLPYLIRRLYENYPMLMNIFK